MAQSAETLSSSSTVRTWARHPTSLSPGTLNVQPEGMEESVLRKTVTNEC